MLWVGWLATTPQTVEVSEMMARVEPEPKAWFSNGNEKRKDRSVTVLKEKITEEKEENGRFVM